jgi:hypothetical protein
MPQAPLAAKEGKEAPRRQSGTARLEDIVTRLRAGNRGPLTQESLRWISTRRSRMLAVYSTASPSVA